MDPSTHYHYLKKREVGIDEANTVEHFMKEFGRGTEMDGPLVTQWTLVMNFLIALLGEGYYEERGPRGRHGRSSSTYLALPAWLVTQLQTALSAKRLSRKKKRPPKRPLASRPCARGVTPCRRWARAGGTEWALAVGNGAGRRYTQLRI